MKKQKENSHEGITWSEMGKQNVQAEKVYSLSARLLNDNRRQFFNAWKMFHLGFVVKMVITKFPAIH